jgi:hypothetical protein
MESAPKLHAEAKLKQRGRQRTNGTAAEPARKDSRTFLMSQCEQPNNYLSNPASSSELLTGSRELTVQEFRTHLLQDIAVPATH